MPQIGIVLCGNAYPPQDLASIQIRASGACCAVPGREVPHLLHRCIQDSVAESLKATRAPAKS